MNISEFHDHSIKEKEAFWKKQAENIFWFEFPKTILDYSSPPFVRWFPDGKINLCYNAVDIHLKNRADQTALIYVSTETNSRKKFSSFTSGRAMRPGNGKFPDARGRSSFN